ncbi:MAG: hypothetical protein WAX33_04325 [Rectinemataceae bacterium]
MIVSRPDYQPIPTGMQPAVIANIIDLGLQPGFREIDPPRRRVAILFELLERRSDGARFLISEEYTATLADDSNLRKMLEGWADRLMTTEELEGFELNKIKGKACTLELVKKPKSNSPGVWVSIAQVHKRTRNIPAWVPETSETFIPDYLIRRMCEAITIPEAPDSFNEIDPADAGPF